MAANLRRRFVEYMEEENLLRSGSDVIAGISGGADSVCLLILLSEIRKDLNITVTAVHVNHMLRGEDSEEDQVFVENLCKTLGVSLKVFRRDIASLAKQTGESLEEAGRRARYEILSAEAKRSDTSASGIIAVAHHKNDDAETFVLNLARGASLKGLSGMRSKTQIDGVFVIRPLLFAFRTEIEDFLSEINQSYRTDFTNSDTQYSRNRIRHKIIPELGMINSGAVDHIVKSSAEIRKAYEYIEEAVKEAAADIVSAGTNVRGEKIVTLSAEALMSKPDIIASKVVYEAVGFSSGALKDISDKHVAGVLSLASLPTGSRVNLPYGLSAERKYESIVISPSKVDVMGFASKEHIKNTIFPKNDLERGPIDVFLPEFELAFHMELTDVTPDNFPELTEKNQYTKIFDYDKIKRNFVFGTRETGDDIAISGGRKSIRRYFTDEKIPAEERDRIVLLKDDEEVIWVVGRRISESYKITPETGRAVKISVEGETDGY